MVRRKGPPLSLPLSDSDETDVPRMTRTRGQRNKVKDDAGSSMTRTTHENKNRRKASLLDLDSPPSVKTTKQQISTRSSSAAAEGQKRPHDHDEEFANEEHEFDLIYNSADEEDNDDDDYADEKKNKRKSSLTEAAANKRRRTPVVKANVDASESESKEGDQKSKRRGKKLTEKSTDASSSECRRSGRTKTRVLEYNEANSVIDYLLSEDEDEHQQIEEAIMKTTRSKSKSSPVLRLTNSASNKSRANNRRQSKAVVEVISSELESESESQSESDSSDESSVEEFTSVKIDCILGVETYSLQEWKKRCANMDTHYINNGSMFYENTHHRRKKQTVADDDAEKEETRYLVKWKGLSYLHISWEVEEDIDEYVDYQKLSVCLAKYYDQKSMFELSGDEYFTPEYLQIDRILEINATDDGEEEYFIKWKSLTYDECTWEQSTDIRDDIAIERYEKINTRKLLRGKNSKKKKAFRMYTVDKNAPKFKYPSQQLRSYQVEGLNWLLFNWYNDRNSILADEMGLGKTLQSVSFVHHLVEKEGRGITKPFLIIAPLSTLPHWYREFQSWTELNTILYHGSAEARARIREYEFDFFDDQKSSTTKRGKSKSKREQQYKFSVLITSPESCIAQDFKFLSQINWEVIIIDEAHRLKNRNSRFHKQLVTHFQHDGCICLTGTPLQNNIEELWTLLNFIAPEYFEDVDEFIDKYDNLQESDKVKELQTELRPFLLRRMKEDVEKSIAPKEEILIEVELTMLQKQYYRAIYEKNHEFLAPAGKTKTQLRPSLMNILMQLRKCCNHPYLIRGVEERNLNMQQLKSKTKIKSNNEKLQQKEEDRVNQAMIDASGKLVLLDKLLPALKQNDHRVLLFSQFKIMLDILEDYLRYRVFPFERIDGGITGNDRQAAIDRFCGSKSNDKKATLPFIMLLSTKAGGVGINLTAADTCIIYDSDWNPQNDIQAQARCHRIGQTKSVKIYRLLTTKTYECSMFHKASLKLGLDQAVLGGMKSNSTAVMASSSSGTNNSSAALSNDDIENLLKHGAYEMFREEKEGKAEAASRQFSEATLDQILSRSTKIIHGPSVTTNTDDNGNASEPSNDNQKPGSSSSLFSKATFVSSNNDPESAELELNDPDFWTKVVGLPSKPIILESSPNKGNRLRRRASKNRSYKEDSKVLDDLLGDDHDLNEESYTLEESFQQIHGAEDDGSSDDEPLGIINPKVVKSLKKPPSMNISYSNISANQCAKWRKYLAIYGYGNWTKIQMKSTPRVNIAVIIKYCQDYLLLGFCMMYLSNKKLSTGFNSRPPIDSSTKTAVTSSSESLAPPSATIDNSTISLEALEKITFLDISGNSYVKNILIHDLVMEDISKRFQIPVPRAVEERDNSESKTNDSITNEDCKTAEGMLVDGDQKKINTAMSQNDTSSPDIDVSLSAAAAYTFSKFQISKILLNDSKLNHRITSWKIKMNQLEILECFRLFMEKYRDDESKLIRFINQHWVERASTDNQSPNLPVIATDTPTSMDVDVKKSHAADGNQPSSDTPSTNPFEREEWDEKYLKLTEYYFAHGNIASSMKWQRGRDDILLVLAISRHGWLNGKESLGNLTEFPFSFHQDGSVEGQPSAVRVSAGLLNIRVRDLYLIISKSREQLSRVLPTPSTANVASSTSTGKTAPVPVSYKIPKSKKRPKAPQKMKIVLYENEMYFHQLEWTNEKCQALVRLIQSHGLPVSKAINNYSIQSRAYLFSQWKYYVTNHILHPIAIETLIREIKYAEECFHSVVRQRPPPSTSSSSSDSQIQNKKHRYNFLSPLECGLLVDRIDFFRILRSKILVSSFDTLAEMFQSIPALSTSGDAGLMSHQNHFLLTIRPSWWCTPTHDILLLQGLDNFGFGVDHFKSIWELSTFESAAKACSNYPPSHDWTENYSIWLVHQIKRILLKTGSPSSPTTIKTSAGLNHHHQDHHLSSSSSSSPDESSGEKKEQVSLVPQHSQRESQQYAHLPSYENTTGRGGPLFHQPEALPSSSSSYRHEYVYTYAHTQQHPPAYEPRYRPPPYAPEPPPIPYQNQNQQTQPFEPNPPLVSAPVCHLKATTATAAVVPSTNYSTFDPSHSHFPLSPNGSSHRQEKVVNTAYPTLAGYYFGDQASSTRSSSINQTEIIVIDSDEE